MLLASAGLDVKIWNLQLGTEVCSFPTNVKSLAFSPNGKMLIYCNRTNN
jgi:WD40 repeat protein